MDQSTFLSAFFGLCLDGDILPPFVPPVHSANGSKSMTNLKNSTEKAKKVNVKADGKNELVGEEHKSAPRKMESLKLEQLIIVSLSSSSCV
jgi:hypothetical protein